MDLHAVEQAMKTLESEAARVRGLGDLTDQLATTGQELRQRVLDISTASEALLSLARADEKRRQEASRGQIEILENLDRKIREFQAEISGLLQKNTDALSAGAAQTHRQLQELTRQIDDSVKAELSRSVGALRASIDASLVTLGRQSDLSAREQRQSMKGDLDAARLSLQELIQKIHGRIATAGVILGGLIICGFLVLGWLIGGK